MNVWPRRRVVAVLVLSAASTIGLSSVLGLTTGAVYSDVETIHGVVAAAGEEPAPSVEPAGPPPPLISGTSSDPAPGSGADQGSVPEPVEQPADSDGSQDAEPPSEPAPEPTKEEPTSPEPAFDEPAAAGPAVPEPATNEPAPAPEPSMVASPEPPAPDDGPASGDGATQPTPIEDAS